MGLIHLTTVTLPSLSGNARDNVVNTFVAKLETDWLTGDFVSWETKLTAFYNAPGTGSTNPVASYIGPQISRALPAIFRHYNIDGHLSGSPHGSPVRVQSMALLNGSGGTTVSWPEEAAVAASYHSAYGTDVEFTPGARPRARDRGRVFIGPVASNVASQDATTKRCKVSTGVITDLIGAMRALAGGTGPQWVLWSRKAAAVKSISHVSVDDALDTQRRRGPSYVTKTVWALP